MPNKISKIAEGLAAWLCFEKRCGRQRFFSESYLAYPLAQLLQYRFQSKVLTEIEHPVLNQLKTGPGSRPRIDFGIPGGTKVLELAVETKWLSGSSTLVRDMIRDIVRLDLLVPEHAKSGILLVAGETRDFARLFRKDEFWGSNTKRQSKPILPLIKDTGTLNLQNPESPRQRSEFFDRVLSAFGGVQVSKSIPLARSGPYPAHARTRDYQVYIWRLRSFSGKGPRFLVQGPEPISRVTAVHHQK
jgi:hypothetical protein